MRILEIIESKHWVNQKTGQTASLYGAVPWTGSQGDWKLETRGWTWRLDNGTIGLGRIPAKTREEAEAVMQEFNSRGKV